MGRWTTGTTVQAGLVLLVLGIAMLAAPLAVSAQTTPNTWRATLAGASESPATTSTATGTFSATLDETAGTLTWTLSVPNIKDATAAHIHTGAAGANGPVVLNLFAAIPTGPTTILPASSISTSGTARAIDLVGPLAQNFPGLVSAIKGGTAYVNVHTVANPGGEIRGQITQATATATPTATATATATATPKAAAPVATPAPTVVPSAPKSGSGGYSSSTSLTQVALALLAVASGVALVAAAVPARRRR